ncbi:HTH-type transcriptional regulator CdhR [Roseivivax jejudonensis]|uniref:HTH-type transcriptional regulator CdhR n=1 Tax=Roseivivax jejudonensis TaxID=1529041 RepID=A0A1X6ZAK1_9RHOB|nr:helix-turn-helix domain-containing protein [Roseivivax jejudonensis]SLN45889.1 HTH-type transcriptional regulator CdhR [Roseivivax jejudonensis]
MTSMTEGSDKLDVAVVLVNEGYASTAVGPIEVFSAAGTMWNEMRGDAPEPRFRVTTASIDGAPVRSAYGLNIAPDRAIADLGPLDLAMVSASGPVPDDWMARHAAIPPWLAERYRNGTRIAGVCSGVAFLAEAGLLDGRRATTHWGVADGFKRRYPDVAWETDLLITEDAGLYCSGGVNAASDLSLHLVERLCGRDLAIECSKALLLDMPRPSQSGYALLPLARPHDDDKVRKAEHHLSSHFARDLPVEEIVDLLGMSRRNFVRRFHEATGHMPGVYQQMLRVAAARKMLEDGAPSIEQVGRAVGYEDVAFFRSVFKRHSGTTPSAYRDRFRHHRG